jgi:very-short-patch-repair endonuclease
MKSGCLGILLALFQKETGFKAGKNTAPEYPYGKRDDFLSPAELSFFHVLKSILSPEYHLITKVRLSDLFFVKQPPKNQAAQNRINQKHVDFVICQANTMEPILAIELDDSTHQRKDRQERDDHVDKVFEAAGFTLVHIKAAKGYQPDELRQTLSAAWPADPK